jgi:glutamate carboxypeptidase
MSKTLFHAVAASLALLAAGLAVSAQAAPKDPADAKMVAAIQADHVRNLALLEAMVKVNSGTMNFKGVEQVGQMVRAELEPLGFAVRWSPMAASNRAGHIVATHKGNGRGARMLLIGHLDTVFELDSPFQAWTPKGNDIVEGPGTSDMKGGDVIMIAALRAMQAAGTLKDADITVVMTGDEEKRGAPLELDRKDLIDAGHAADVALEFEGLARDHGQDIGSIARRSSGAWTVRAHAKSGHSSGVCTPQAGCGAIYELARILDDFRRELPEPHLTYNVGLISGGSSAKINATDTGATATGKSNVISAEAVAVGDIRTLSPEQEARVRAKMAAIVARHLNRTTAEISFADTGYPAMAPTEGSRALLARLNQVNVALGLPEMPEGDPDKRGAGDIALVGFLPGLVGLGMAGEGAHAPGETADLKSMDVQAERAALLMRRLSQEPRPK